MNIYLITSSSHRLIEDEINKIAGNNSLLNFNMINNELNSLLEECGYSFFMDEIKYILVKNFFSNMRESDEEKIMNCLKSPNKKVILIFVEEKVDARKKIIKYINKNYCFKNIMIDNKNIYGIVNDYITKNNYKYDFYLTKYLVNLYTSNIDLIFSELDKVFLYYEKPVLLNVENVKDIISIPLTANSFKFIDAVVEKNLPIALDILEDLIIYKVEMVSLIILLAREFRLIMYIKEYSKQKIGLQEIATNLNMKEWQVQKYYKNSFLYSEDEIKNIIKILGEYDCKIKTGVTNGYSAIQLCILEIIV